MVGCGDHRRLGKGLIPVPVGDIKCALPSTSAWNPDLQLGSERGLCGGKCEKEGKAELLPRPATFNCLNVENLH